MTPGPITNVKRSDDIVMTGHMGPETAVGDLLVTVGGTQKRLADALAPELNPAVTAKRRSRLRDTLKVTGPAANAPRFREVNALTDVAAKAAGSRKWLRHFAVPVGGFYRTGNSANSRSELRDVMVRLV